MQPTFNTTLTATFIAVLFMTTACQRDTTTAAVDAPMFTSQNGQFTVPEKSPLRTHILVAAVGDSKQARQLSLSATVEADPSRTTNILAPLTGKITALKVGIGDHVKAGQVLLVISSGDLAAAYADVDKAADAHALAKRAYERALGVKDAGAAPVKDLEAAESAVVQSQAELNRAQIRLKSLGGAPGDTHRELVLTAPQAGVVTALNVAAGSNVSDPTATLIAISNIDQVFITANVDEADVRAVVKGSDVDISLTAYPERVLHAKITSVNDALEPDTRRQKVRIAMANADGSLKPNMYATVKVAVPGTEQLSIPQSALLMNNDAISVLAEVQPWVFQRKVVKIGEDDGDKVHVLSGLNANDRIVVKGGVLLND